MIVVEPEKQLTLLFGMKAPGLGRLCFSLEDKGDYRTIDVRAFWHPHGMPGLFYWLLMIPAHLFIFRGMAKQIARLAEQSTRLIDKTCVILSCFPLHHGGNHGRMRTLFSQQQWIDMKVLVTGATSGLGRNAIEFLCQKGISVRATGRNEAMGKLLEKMGAEFVPADLTELVPSQAKVMLAGIDTLWHCLPSFTSPWGTQQAFDLANVRATRRLGEWAVAWGVRNFIHIFPLPVLRLSPPSRY